MLLLFTAMSEMLDHMLSRNDILRPSGGQQVPSDSATLGLGTLCSKIILIHMCQGSGFKRFK
jgi:hypothetical protein